MQTHASTELHNFLFLSLSFIFLYCISAELEIYSVTHYNMGLKKIQLWITLLLKRCLYFLTCRKQGVLFQQGVFPFVLTFAIFALGCNQKKKLSFD